MLDGPPNVQLASSPSFNEINFYSFADLADLDMAYAPDENMTNALQQRHLGVGNVLFLDGHVEQHSYLDYCANIPKIGGSHSVGSDPYDTNTAPDFSKHWIDMAQ